MERFAARFERQASAEATGNTFSGYASVFGSVVDSWIPTVIERGAFSRSLANPRVKILWQHDVWEPIGIPTELREDEKGLYIAGRISDTAAGRDCLTLLRDGVVDELSIGFTPVRDEMRRDLATKREVRHVHDLDLHEVSIVTFAADPMAQIAEVHARALDMIRHEGRVLSGVNRTRVQKALEALQELLAASEPKEEDAAPPPETLSGFDVQLALARLRQIEIGRPRAA